MEADGRRGAAVGGALCRHKAAAGNGIGNDLRCFAFGQDKYLRAETWAKTAADAGLTVDGCVHKDSPFPLEYEKYARKPGLPCERKSSSNLKN